MKWSPEQIITIDTDCSLCDTAVKPLPTLTPTVPVNSLLFTDRRTEPSHRVIKTGPCGSREHVKAMLTRSSIRYCGTAQVMTAAVWFLTF